MDNSFQYFSEMLLNMTAVDGRFSSTDAGFEMEIEKISIETPVELSINVSSSGKVEIGTVPPLYHVETTFQPSYHSITIHAEKYQD